MTADTPALEPCPFCGLAARWIEDDGHGDCMIFCPGEYQGCEAYPVVHMPKSKWPDCIAAWNRRSGTDALRALVNKIDQIEADSSFQGIWSYLHVHNYAYTGPSWEKELSEARAALGSAPQGEKD